MQRIWSGTRLHEGREPEGLISHLAAANTLIQKLSTSMRGRKRVHTIALYGFVNVLPKLISGALVVFYSRVFSAGEYANYGIFASVIYLLATAIDLGFASATLRNFYAEKNRSSVYLSSAVQGSRLIALALLPFFGALLYLFWDQLGVRFTQVWLFAPALLLIAYLGRAGDMLATICRAIDRPGYFAAGQIVQTAGLTLFGIGLVFGFRLGIGGALLAMVISQAAGLFAYHVLLAREFDVWRGRLDWTAIKDGLVFGLPLVPDRITGWVRMMALRPTLIHLVPLQAVGWFTFASSLAAIPNLLSAAIDLALAPVYFRQRESSGSDEFHAKILGFGTVYVASMLPVWVSAILFCPELISFIAGPRYAGAAPVCGILLCASFVRFQLPFLLRQIHFMRRTWMQPAITIPWGLILIVMSIVLCGRYGMTAAGWCSLGTEFGILVTTALAIRRHEQIGYPIATGVFFIAILALLAAWVANHGGSVDWHMIVVKLGCVLFATAASFAIWIWPKRQLVLQLASG